VCAMLVARAVVPETVGRTLERVETEVEGAAA
jgi:hypothetical protein